MQFYKPLHGDTAAAVADGYDDNFQTLDATKADAEATLAALDTKVDKVDGAGLMTDPEREKLAGIETAANNYLHPQTHPADLITDTDEKVIMTAVERQKLAGIEAGANAYSLPAATADTLGGVKAGKNVTISEDGTLSATGGNGNFYTIDFELTDLEQQKTVLNGLLTAYAADPKVQVRVKADPFLLTPSSCTITPDSVVVACNLSTPADSISGPLKSLYVIIAGVRSVPDGPIDLIGAWGSQETDILNEIPIASSRTLGGIKVGNNLSMREDGTLDAVAGGGSGSGAGLLVLPYVAPERDAEGNITNSAAFVTAWGAILSQYLASPQQYSLCLEMDVTGDEGALVQMPCTMLNMGGDADAVQWLLSGFTVVNMPVSSTTSASCKATCMMVIVCNAAGQMQSVEMCATTGIVGSDGQPNLLGGDDPIIVDIEDNATEDQLKTALQPAVHALQINPSRRVLLRYGLMLMPATTAISDAEFLIAVMDANPLTVSDPNSTWVVKAVIYCRHLNGTIQSAVGGVTGFEVATIDTLKNATPVDQLKATDRLLVFNGSSYPVTATALQLNDYIQSQAPQPTYRNLCLNSRGDNLNCWDAWSGADRIELDTAKFGRPVIKITKQAGTAAWWCGLLADKNIPELRQYIGTDVPFPQPVTVAYDMWCNYAVEVRAWHESTDVVTVVANKFQRVKHTIPAGTVLGNIGMGVTLIEGKPDLEAYYENIQVEWGTEATPYCYNAALPQSLTEQLVPGEYWDGKQVYQRTFKGTLPTTPLEGQWLCPLTQGLRVVPVQAKGWVSQENWGDPYLAPNSKVDIISKGWYGLSMIFDSTLAGREYYLTAKYTKA